MAVNLKFNSNRIEKTQSEKKTYQTYISPSETEIDAFISTWNVGANYELGVLNRITKSLQDTFFECELEFGIGYEGGSSSEEQIFGVKSAQLSVRMMSNPLENHEYYLCNWNHYLIALDNAPVPNWWYTATTPWINPSTADFKNYRWVSSLSEIPTEPDEDGKYWNLCSEDTIPQKPGVETFDVALFVVTETEKYGSLSQASNAVNSNINTIISPQNDFNLGGSWKYDDARVYFNGKYWVVESTYTRAYDTWDTDLY